MANSYLLYDFIYMKRQKRWVFGDRQVVAARGRGWDREWPTPDGHKGTLLGAIRLFQHLS